MKLAAGIREIVQNKGVSEELVLDAVKEVLDNAYKEFFGAPETQIDIDLNKDVLRVLIPKKVVKRVRDPRFQINPKQAAAVLGMDEVDESIEQVLVPFNPTDDFSPTEIMRISESILYKIREFEKNALRYEYSKKKIDIVSGTIIKISEDGDIFVDLGKTIGVLPKNEQSPLEHYENGDIIKSVIIAVDNYVKNPKTGKKIKKLQVTLSRKTPALIKELLFSEIPEIADRSIDIKGIARIVGYKTKVLVQGNTNVDPVAACIGPHGIRIISIIKEIGGEKIDIIKYSDDIRELIKTALTPAKVERIIVSNEEENFAYAVVSPDQLPYAFGRQKQNVILVSKLTNFRIQVKTPSEILEEDIGDDTTDLKDIFGTTLSMLGLTDEVMSKLHNHEIFSVEQLAELHMGNLYHLLDDFSEEEISLLKKVIHENIEIEENTAPITEDKSIEEDEETALDVLPGLKPEWIPLLNANEINSVEDLVSLYQENDFSDLNEFSEEDKNQLRQIILENIEIEE